MSRGHDPRYLAVKLPDQYADARCPNCDQNGMP